jgi:hypothetical protein
MKTKLSVIEVFGLWLGLPLPDKLGMLNKIVLRYSRRLKGIIYHGTKPVL